MYECFSQNLFFIGKNYCTCTKIIFIRDFVLQIQLHVESLVIPVEMAVNFILVNIRIIKETKPKNVLTN
jgi:hypothetical protein